MKPKFVKLVKATHPINWWNRHELLGKTFEVLEVVNNRAKIEYFEGHFGYVPLEVCEIDPHLKIVN